MLSLRLIKSNPTRSVRNVKICTRLQSMLEKNQNCDCKFLVHSILEPGKDTVISAHWLILAAASDSLGQLALAGRSAPVYVPDVSGPVFKLILTYAYTGNAKFNSINSETILELYVAAGKFNLLSLNDRCAAELYSRLINPDCNSYNIFSKASLLEPKIKKLDEIRHILHVKFSSRPCTYIRSVVMATESSFLEKLFTFDLENVSASEFFLFATLNLYATAHGWKPNGEFYSEDEDDSTASSDASNDIRSLIKDVRAALKQIRFRCMSEEQAARAARAGRLTREEAAAVRARAAPPGFSELAHPRYSTLPMEKFAKGQIHDSENGVSCVDFSFKVCLSEVAIGATPVFNFMGRMWHIRIITKRLNETCLKGKTLAVVWACVAANKLSDANRDVYAQLDIFIRDAKGTKIVYDNFSWYRFKASISSTRSASYTVSNDRVIIDVKMEASWRHKREKENLSKICVKYDMNCHYS